MYSRLITCSFSLPGCTNVTTLDCSPPACQPSPQTAALGGVPPASGARPLALRHLDLSDCARLSDAGLERAARAAPHLQHLYLRRCVGITGR